MGCHFGRPSKFLPHPSNLVALYLGCQLWAHRFLFFHSFSSRFDPSPPDGAGDAPTTTGDQTSRKGTRGGRAATRVPCYWARRWQWPRDARAPRAGSRRRRPRRRSWTHRSRCSRGVTWGCPARRASASSSRAPLTPPPRLLLPPVLLLLPPLARASPARAAPPGRNAPA